MDTENGRVRKRGAFYVCGIVIPLVLGLLIYLVYRPDTRLASAFRIPAEWTEALYPPLDSPVIGFLRGYASDILWACALAFAVCAVLRTEKRQRWIPFLVCVAFESCMECLQLTARIPGTFDLWDILLESASTGLAFLIITIYEEKQTQ